MVPSGVSQWLPLWFSGADSATRHPERGSFFLFWPRFLELKKTNMRVVQLKARACESLLMLNVLVLRRDVVLYVYVIRKKRMWPPRMPFACGPTLCPFSRTSNVCLSTTNDTLGSTALASLWDLEEPDARRSATERDLGSMAGATHRSRLHQKRHPHELPHHVVDQHSAAPARQPSAAF